VVFQDFARYSVSMGENIALGNAPAMQDADYALFEAAELAGISGKIHELPDGLNTNLGKLKEGSTDLSGGEWQRVVMARAILSPASLKILDEPTAALDPISESKVYEKFEQISQGKTTIFISHRLGSTKLADFIIVLENGGVIEQGSHEELMALCGVYAKMYESQRSWYR